MNGLLALAFFDIALIGLAVIFASVLNFWLWRNHFRGMSQTLRKVDEIDARHQELTRKITAILIDKAKKQ